MSSTNAQTVHTTPEAPPAAARRRPSRAGKDSKPAAPAAIAFKQISFGFWRAETSTHRLEIRLVRAHGPSSNTHYFGTLTRRVTLTEVTCCKSALYPACQQKLIQAMTLDIEKQARKPGKERALCTFEDFDGDRIEATLLRRRDVFLKRWNLVAISNRFTAGKVDGRATRILIVATEEAAP